MKLFVNSFKAVLFTSFTIIYFQLSAQSLYEIKFKDKQNNQYSGLLVFFNETNAYMRIGYTYNNVYNVVNVTYLMQKGTNSQGTEYSMLRGSNPVYITENKLNLRYNPDFFIWFYNKSLQKWDSPYTTDDSLLNPASYVKVDTYNKLEPTTVTDTYLRSFFWSNESQYFALRKMCGLEKTDVSPVYTNTTKAAKLYLLLVANTKDPSIGTSCSNDESNLTNEFKQVADALNIGYSEQVVDGTYFSKQNVQNALNTISPGTNDIIVFIYRGHGFRWKDQTEDWPRMDLRLSSYSAITENSSMNLSEVYSALTAKGARLNIILGDCCNSEVNISPVTSSNYMTFQVDNNSDVSKLRNLFINSKGTILSAAAQKGEVSWAATQGGLYSMSFLQAFHEEISYFNTGNADWENIIQKTIRLARTKSTKEYCPNCSLQNGIKYTSLAHSNSY